MKQKTMLVLGPAFFRNDDPRVNATVGGAVTEFEAVFGPISTYPPATLFRFAVGMGMAWCTNHVQTPSDRPLPEGFTVDRDVWMGFVGPSGLESGDEASISIITNLAAEFEEKFGSFADHPRDALFRIAFGMGLLSVTQALHAWRLLVKKRRPRLGRNRRRKGTRK